jgi:hypothetical protein
MKNQMKSQSWPMTQAWMATGTEAGWARGSEHESEMLDFMSHRLSKASEAVRELGQCRSWKGASGVHSKMDQGDAHGLLCTVHEGGGHQRQTGRRRGPRKTASSLSADSGVRLCRSAEHAASSKAFALRARQ